MTAQAGAKTPYYTTYGGHPPQTDLLTDRAVVTEAYTVIPRGVLRDIVTSVFPEWTNTRAWVLNRPVAGGPTTFAQSIVEVGPGGGAEKPEPQAEVSGFVFVVAGELSLSIEGENHVLAEGGFAYLPAGAQWSAKNNAAEVATFHWIRKRYEPLAGWPPRARWSATSRTSRPAPCPTPTASGAPPGCWTRTTWPSTSG